MIDLIKKLNYKGQQRITVINASENFLKAISSKLKGVQIDTEFDQRFLYEFMIVFVTLVSEVEILAPVTVHNLAPDGILWFAYPKKTSRKYSSDIDRDHGWQILTNYGFDKVRQVAIDNDWSALRFRNLRFIKSGKSRTCL
jgi:hypothetical protein